jgi:signal transduction histidine kinase
MNRKLLIQVTAPTVIIGLLLFLACVVGAWHIARLQRDMARLLSEEVVSLQAAQDLEIAVRQLRFHSFLNLLDPLHARPEPIEKSKQSFESALANVRSTARGAKEQKYVQEIEKGYQRYKEELKLLPAEIRRWRRPGKLYLGPTHLIMQSLGAQAASPAGASLGPLTQRLAALGIMESDPFALNLHQLVDAHPIQLVVKPCENLSSVTKEMMKETVQESNEVSQLVRLVMIVLGLIGPVSGLMSGYGIARGLSRSIYQLSVRVQGMAQRLDQDVASVSVAADGDIQNLDKQLQHVVERVEEVAQRVQQHQREMLRAEQLSAVGQLAASVAHEVRNPLTSVKLLVEAALRPRRSEHAAQLSDEDLQVIHREVVRLEQTVQNFLDFARPPTPRRSACDLREVVAHTLDLVRARARQQGVTLAVSAPSEPVSADVDRGQLSTVLVNLFLNALDAMPRGGRLGVELRSLSDQEIRLDVTDTGGGIAPEIVGRLFTPFASTKATGTGLGLSISRRLIEEHGGSLGAHNRAEGGACFTIRLPASVAHRFRSGLPIGFIGSRNDESDE